MDGTYLLIPPPYSTTMIKAIKQLAKEKGYVISEKPHYLNIWGFRANNKTANSFDDQIHVFTVVESAQNPVWAYWVFKCTTDPGTFWLRNPDQPQGTAILHPGQYINSHGIGLHRGKYTALVQIGRLKVIRDYNRDNVLDFNNGKVVNGLYGINIHHASKHGSTLRVEKYSAGCQVFKNINDFDFFMGLCQKHRKLYGNKFTYTLIDKQMEYITNLKQNTPTDSYKSVSNQYDLKPATYSVFSASSIADLIHSGIQGKNMDTVLKGLFRITNVVEYRQVNEFIKAKYFGSETGKTIAKMLAKVFTKDPHRTKYRAQLYRIGLKWGEKGWTLSGTESNLKQQLFTNQDAVIWDKNQNYFSVPYRTNIGEFITALDGVTTFRSTDGQTYFIHTTSINSL